jgi:hypothetical protein
MLLFRPCAVAAAQGFSLPCMFKSIMVAAIIAFIHSPVFKLLRHEFGKLNLHDVTYLHHFAISSFKAGN